MFHALHCWSSSENFPFTYYCPNQSGCILNHFTQRCAIWYYAVPLHAELCTWPLIVCTVWMYAKLFHEKLCHLMLCCITWSNTVPFHLGLTHLTPRWTVSLDTVPFHAQLFHLSLCQLLLCCAILCNAIPFDITLAQVKLCCAAWTLIGSLFVLWHDCFFFCCTI